MTPMTKAILEIEVYIKRKQAEAIAAEERGDDDSEDIADAKASGATFALAILRKALEE